MNKLISAALLVITLYACKNEHNSGNISDDISYKMQKDSIRHKGISAVAKYKVNTFAVGATGWGFDIEVNEKKVIVQRNIPGILKQVPFFTREDADRTGRLALTKLSKGEIPPMISKEEIDSLGIKVE